MVYTSQQTVGRRILDIGVDTPADTMDFSGLLDPMLLQAARQIYQSYYEVHTDQIQRPLGVALDRFTYRGQLIFTRKPILLPQECFVPINQLES
ncbi:MAG TPA: hypothetical protein V6C88_21105 [Chroococcidiopsis sp.]